ncbi:activity-regulated cytoskeleton-associated protein-like [Bacillus rossius redtenbacheri]|uniref:activity-regulated cytoskeleton-associated protein-like n=1 Tax=Bacillus rossius redtenbacheri TaxID=93214 RepID=UPI002FDC8B1E
MTPRPFRGQDHEDPVKQLQHWEQALQTQGIPQGEWIDHVGGLLMGEATGWWKSHEGLYDTWEDFASSFANQFGSLPRIAELTAQLFSRKQKDNEEIESFLARKKKLYERLYPDRNVKEFLPTALELVRPNLRPFLRHPPPKDWAELHLRATAVQRDYQETRSTPHGKVNAFPTREEKPGSRQEVPKCWYCPERHFNAECPVRRQQRDTQDKKPLQGNA